MFKQLDSESNGFVNEGLDCSEGSDDYNKHGSSSVYTIESDSKIEITRTKYSQESLFREMAYRNLPSQSCEYVLFT